LLSPSNQTIPRSLHDALPIFTAELAAYSVAVQQVVAIARAVDLSGKVLILDEPTASLDAHEVAMLFRIVRRLRERGLGIVFITQDWKSTRLNSSHVKISYAVF